MSFLLTSFLVLAKNPCGSAEWRFSPHNQKCYKLFPEHVDWSTGEFTCDYYGGHHVSIHNLVDNKFVAGKLNLRKKLCSYTVDLKHINQRIRKRETINLPNLIYRK